VAEIFRLEAKELLDREWEDGYASGVHDVCNELRYSIEDTERSLILLREKYLKDKYGKR